MIKAINKIKFALNVNKKVFPKSKPVSKENAIWFKNNLQNMGPVYIKIGQFISTRNDFFSKSVVEELKKLQDNVEPINEESVLYIINNNLDIKQFRAINRIPIASASIGQVHKAYLNNGNPCVLKILRPNILKDINNDVYCLDRILFFLRLLKQQDIVEIKDLFDELKMFLLKEVDFENEINNINTFNKFDNNRLLVPKVLTEMSTKEIIAMSYVPSVKFSTLKDKLDYEERKQIAFDLMDLFLTQLMDYGILHGDPHEGNICYNETYNKFVMYDLGNVIHVSENFRNSLKKFFFELMIENTSSAFEILKDMDYIEIRDEASVKQYLQKYMEYMKTIDITIFTNELKSLDKDTIISIPIKLDSVVFRIIRSFGLIEGICKELDEEFNYIPLFYKYSRVLSQDAEFIDYKVRNDIKIILNLLKDVL